MSGELALVVDDDVTNREALSELLEDLGYRVISAENGARALELSRKQPAPSLILLDLLMPVMTGWQFLEERKRDAALSNIPVVVISATAAAAAELPNVAGYVKKPIDPDAITKVLLSARAGQPQLEATEGEPAAPAPVQKTVLRVLLVQEADEDAGITLAQLASGRDFRFDAKRVRSIAQGLERAVPEAADVVLVDLSLSAEGGTAALKKLVRRMPGVPVVAILRPDDAAGRAEALRVGAQDALTRDAQTPEVLGRALSHAFERFRLKHELERTAELAAHERERKGLANLSQSRSSISAELLGHQPLRHSAPKVFEGFVRDFVATCEKAIADREHEVHPSTQRAELQRLADELARVRAGPGDIVDVYQEALSRGWSAESSQLGAAKREEARLMLIAVLGYVLAAYRLYVN
ncbi:MAG: response regulator [Myxococcaceae bacterium]|nr:response regulator [Myxococcaceae bacterium]